MLLDFKSINVRGPFLAYEIAPAVKRQSNGSFIICSVKNRDFKPIPGITGTIRGATIVLNAGGEIMPHRLCLGNKSINQLRLWLLGFHIPDTVVLDFSIYDKFKREEKFDFGDIYNSVIAPRVGSSVAVRCSSNLEDSDEQSFAGYFDTYLDVPNQVNEIEEKIISSYKKFYAGNNLIGTPQYNIQLSIMVQQMILPKFSGFLFTLDPINPSSNWRKVEYWQGPRGDREGYSITLNRETGKRVSSGRDSNQYPLPIDIQQKLHHAATELEHHFSIPQDVEFLISGSDDDLYLVQSRPITAFSYSPDKVRVDELQKFYEILEDNRKRYHHHPVLSATNISELFPRAIPLGYSIFQYGFSGTDKLEGGVSIGRKRLGYAKLAPEDGFRLYYRVADQARINLIVDALTFRLPGIRKRQYLDLFVKSYLDEIEHNPGAANYPEDGLYLQSDTSPRWLDVAGPRGEHYRAEFSRFLQKIVHVHAPKEYDNSVKFFRRNERCYRAWLDCNLQSLSLDNLRNKIDEILTYLRTTFCPKYVVYARLAFLCTHLAKVRLDEITTQKHPTEKILNKFLRSVSLPGELEEPQYAEFEYLYKQGKIPLVEFLYRFQHLGSLDISQPRLGEYSPEKLCAIFGQNGSSGFDKKFLNDDLTDSHDINILEYNYEQDARFHLLYTNGGRFMLLREKAKSELLKILWALKRILIEFANRNRFGDLIFYLELNELFSLTAENRDVLRMQALQKKAYLDACQQHRVSKVLSDKYAPFEKKPSHKEQDNEHLYRFANGKAICHGHAEGICLTASNNDEFINKLTSYRAKNIENIIGVFKGIELSYFNVSALVGFTTENGGFLSHAATIAREYRLPYISGISIDQVLDGDYLILDTDNEQVIIRR